MEATVSDIKPRAPELDFVFAEPDSLELARVRALAADWNRAARRTNEAIVQRIGPAFRQCAEALTMPWPEIRQPDAQAELEHMGVPASDIHAVMVGPAVFDPDPDADLKRKLEAAFVARHRRR